MDRRRFLKIAGLAGLSVMAPLGLREGSASQAKYPGPFWIMVNAGGGWDPTITFDPKGGKEGDRTSVNQSYAPGDITNSGNIPHAPTELKPGGVLAASCASFLDAYHDRIMVLNGLDTSTNNHDAGSRTIWSGQLAEGYPSFAALVAAQALEKLDLPMAYLSNGGYDLTGGLIPLTRVSGTDTIQRLAYPNIRDPNDPKSDLYHSQATASRIAAAQAARLQEMQLRQTLPAPHKAMGSLYLARESNGGLASLGEALKGKELVQVEDIPKLAAIPADSRNQIDDAERLMQQAQIALFAFKSGVAVSANLDIGGFDTHNDSDDQQTSRQMQLLVALDYLYTQLEVMGLADKTYVMVGSDFGRTPFYNDADGKDHWNITSMLLSGPKIPGNRVIGGTDDGFKPLTVNTNTLKTDGTGVRIEPRHVHAELRRIAGLTGTDLDTQFPLAGDKLNLFG
jgi:Protein of unknown function (DUF1501)